MNDLASATVWWGNIVTHVTLKNYGYFHEIWKIGKPRSSISYFGSNLLVGIVPISVWKVCLQCSDTVGWVAGRASGL